MRRVANVPPDARRLLLLAAADPTGDLALVSRAARAAGDRRGGGASAGIRRLAGSARRRRLPSPVGAVGRVPRGHGGGAKRGASSARGCHRPADGPRPPRVAPRAGDVDAGRGRRRGARAFGGASAGARRVRRGRRVPRALLGPDARPSSSVRARARGRAGEVRGRRVRRSGHARCERRARTRWIASSERSWICFARGSRSPRSVGTMRRDCCSPPPTASSRSTLDGPARSTSRRCPPPCSPVAWRWRVMLARSRPRLGRCPNLRRRPPRRICCSTAWLG